MARQRLVRLSFLPHGPMVVIKRAFWLAMLVFHVGALRAAWLSLAVLPDDGAWPVHGLRFAALGAAALFFALKFIDVRWLRLAATWRSWVISLVIVGLLHVNVVQRLAVGNPVSRPTPLTAVLFVAVLVDVNAVRRQGLRLWSEVVQTAVTSRPRLSRSINLRGTALPEDAVQPHTFLATALLTPRPPPLC